MIKNVKDIRDEFFDLGKLSAQSIKDLIWHIENNPSPDSAISLVTDARLMELVPLIARHLEHEDGFIRQTTVSCLVHRLKLVEYAEAAFKMAQEDSDNGPRDLATTSLGAIINKANSDLKIKIAGYLYDIMFNPKYDNLQRQCAFDAILEALEIPIPQQFAIKPEDIQDLVKKFKEKYDV